MTDGASGAGTSCLERLECSLTEFSSLQPVINHLSLAGMTGSNKRRRGEGAANVVAVSGNLVSCLFCYLVAQILSFDVV